MFLWKRWESLPSLEKQWKCLSMYMTMYILYVVLRVYLWYSRNEVSYAFLQTSAWTCDLFACSTLLLTSTHILYVIVVCCKWVGIYCIATVLMCMYMIYILAPALSCKYWLVLPSWSTWSRSSFKCYSIVGRISLNLVHCKYSNQILATIRYVSIQ